MHYKQTENVKKKIRLKINSTHEPRIIGRQRGIMKWLIYLCEGAYLLVVSSFKKK